MRILQSPDYRLSGAQRPPETARSSSSRRPTLRLSKPPGVTGELFWDYLGALLVLHLLLPLACVPWLFSWTGLILVPLGNYVFGTLGINLGYHRILTHQGLIVPKWLEHALAILGVCNLQDAPARWVGVHRMHHQFSDEQRDPHSPLVDSVWGHLGWLVHKNTYLGCTDFYNRYAPDLMKDPFYRHLERKAAWVWVYVAHAVLMFSVAFLIGWLTSDQSAMGGLQFGLSVFVWGVIVRTVYVWHLTWAVNSVTHRWGYRNYATDDHSRNNWLVALATYGEGWHNNHHAQPRCAVHGHRWWELDLTYWTILLLEKTGLATNVVRPGHNIGRQSANAWDRPARSHGPTLPVMFSTSRPDRYVLRRQE